MSWIKVRGSSVKVYGLAPPHKAKHLPLLAVQPVRAQQLPELRNSPFSVICSDDVLLGDRPFLCDVTA